MLKFHYAILLFRRRIADLVLAALALLIFGALRSVVTTRSWIFSGLKMLTIGSAADTTGYFVSMLLDFVSISLPLKTVA